MKKGNITRFKLSPKKQPKSDWRAFDAMSAEERHRAALSDPDASPESAGAFPNATMSLLLAHPAVARPIERAHRPWRAISPEYATIAGSRSRDLLRQRTLLPRRTISMDNAT
jgi:hypothetical protein